MRRGQQSLPCPSPRAGPGTPLSGNPARAAGEPKGQLEILWDNGVFGGAGVLASERNTIVTLASSADDFLIEEGWWHISRVRATHLNVPDRDLAAADVAFYEGIFPNGGPNDNRLIVEMKDLPVLEVDTGQRPFGFDLNELYVDFPTVSLGPGYYFVVVRGVGNGPQEGNRSFWARTSPGQIILDQGWFKSEYFDVPEWTPVQSMVGVPDEFAWTLYGEVGFAPGDFDGDGDVDIADFSRFTGCYTGSGRPIRNEQCRVADLDNDGDVDIADFSTFAENFTGSQ